MDCADSRCSWVDSFKWPRSWVEIRISAKSTEDVVLFYFIIKFLRICLAIRNEYILSGCNVVFAIFDILDKMPAFLYWVGLKVAT